MECVELSDLEEGEILENENDSLSNLSESWSEEFGGSAKNHFDLVEGCQDKKLGNKENKGNGLLSSENNGYKNLTRKCHLSNSTGNRSNITVVDLGLEEVSSDGDCLSDDDWNHSCDTFGYEVHKKKRSQYGTAEDIMSEIGETISRKKSHSHKKKKTKYNADKYKDNYYTCHRKSSHVKSRKFRRRVDSDSNSDEIFTQGRKRKKRAPYTNEQNIKKPKIRDFVEMRKTLLEKLKKQRAEEAEARTVNLVFAEEEVENSEIQEIEMGIDNTNYVDSPDAGNQNNAIKETKKDKEESNDDLDLMELRLAALESNSKQKATSTSQKVAKIEEKTEVENQRNEDMNLDRYELLLRAEALKTALLKKHQKRLKAKELSNRVNSSNSHFLNTFSPLRGESSSDEKPSTSSTANVVIVEENTSREVPSQVDENTEKNSLNEVRIATPPLMNSRYPVGVNLKKPKSRRKKRKSESLQNNAKENTENTEVLEEDDRTLRSQLLRDLLRKKSLKDIDKKTVLTDSVQTSVNQLPVLSSEQLQEKEKPSANVPKMNSLEKVSVINTTKPAALRIPKPEIKRIIVHLGSEDSSDENDTEENSSSKCREYKEGNKTKESSESVRANYEKSVDLLLSQTWQKIEGELAAARNAQNTPEAVYKHLPLSQRLEYIRLKQKIAERERLKKVKENPEKPFTGSTNQTSTPRRETFLTDSAYVNEAAVTTTASKSERSKPDKNLEKSDIVSKNVPLNSKNFRNLNQENVKQKNVVVSNFNVIKNGRKYVAPPNGLNAAQTNQRRSLLQSSQALISKLKILLKKIKIDKTIEENYEKEISKLKNQINLFEKKKVEQKMKIKKLAEESLKTFKLIQQITNLARKPKEESVKKKDCGEGVSKSEKAIKVSEEPKTSEIVNVPEPKSLEIVKVAEESKNDISKVKGKAEEILNENVSLPNTGPLDYNSPLIAFNKVSDNSDRIDPNVMVCQFDLMGVCKDKECTYQHFRNTQNVQYDPVAGKPVQEE